MLARTIYQFRNINIREEIGIRNHNTAVNPKNKNKDNKVRRYGKKEIILKPNNYNLFTEVLIRELCTTLQQQQQKRIALTIFCELFFSTCATLNDVCKDILVVFTMNYFAFVSIIFVFIMIFL